MNDHIEPCTVPTNSRWYHSMNPNVFAMAMKPARQALTACPVCMIILRSNRSATTPPNSDSTSIGTADATLTTLSSAADPVRSYTR